jgi:hypothetical protein
VECYNISLSEAVEEIAWVMGGQPFLVSALAAPEGAR